MRSFFSLILSLFSIFTCIAQTTIVVEAGPISYTNIDNSIGFSPVEDEYDAIDISDCSSIQFSVDFEFNNPWIGSGSNNMEAASECTIAAGPCAGDPSDPLAGACSSCWDFMWMQFSIGGNLVEDNLLGLDTSTPEDGTITSAIFCTDGETEASILISNQNWAADETNTFENVTILCWEGVPTIDPFPNPLCAGQTIDLIGDAGDTGVVDDWLWTNDMGAAIDQDDIQITTASGVEDGEIFTLTATDVNGCTASAEETVDAAGGFDATLMGGGIICPNSCTDASSNIEIGLVGGVEPYTATLEFNGFSVAIPAFDVDENVIQICHSDGGIAPTLDTGTDPISITIPQIIWGFVGDINIEIVDIEDDSGCTGTINGGGISLSLGSSPTIDQPTILPLCLDIGEEVDLTQYDDDILNGQSCDVIWLDDEDDVTSDINSPSNYNFESEGTTVYAVVFCDPCFSDIIEIELDINVRPEIEIDVSDVEICGMDYELPDFDEIATIIDDNNPSYFLDDDLNFGPFFPGSFLTLTEETEIFIYDESAPNCGAIGSFFVDPLVEPEIDSPSGTITACGVIELPDPLIFNEDDWEYNTEEDASGLAFFEGDEIFDTDGIDMLFLIATTDEGCIDTTHIQLNFLGGTNFAADIERYSCDTLFLSQISPTPTTTSLGFYTSIGTNVTPDFLGGDTLTAQSFPNGTDTLFLYDPLAGGGCSTTDTILFEIGATPQLINPGPQTFCESGTLQGLLVGASPSDSILIVTDNSDTLQVDTPITESTRVIVTTHHVFDNDSLACFQTFIFRVTIIDQPNAGDDATLSVCQGYSQPLDLLTLLGNADPGGILAPGGIPDLDLSDPSQVNVGALPVGTVNLTYSFSEPGCPPDESNFTLEILAPADPGTATDLATCDADTPINLESLFGNPSTQGNWAAIDIDDPALVIPITDPTSVLLSDLPGSGTGYTITHSVINTAADLCEPNVGSVRVTIIDQLVAGDDATAAFCKGTVINLPDLLSSDASAGGTFESEDNLIFFGDTWDTGPTPLGLGPDFNLSYVINTPGCPADTAFFTVTITDELFAGTEAANNSVCEGDLVDLSMFLDDETPGGNFFTSTNLTTPLPDAWVATSTSQFTYIIPGIPGCEADSTDFLVQVFPALNASATLSTDMICEDGCTDLIISSSEAGGTSLLITGDIALNESELITFPLVVGDNFITLCQDDNAFGFDGSNVFNIGNSSEVTVTINEITSDLISCQDIILGQTEIISINRGFELRVDTTICDGTTIEVEGITFTRSTVVNEQTSAGCDSILNINIDFFPPAMKDEDITLCEGESYSINGDILTNEVVDSTIILVGESARGCDSIVLLNLQFDNVVEINFNDRLCADASEIINGTVYDINSNLPETIMLPGVNGDCDTSLVVNFTFSAPLASDNFSPSTCDDIDYNINGETYNFANPIGTELLQDANGCDSIELTINIQDVSTPPEDFIRNICDDEDFEFDDGQIFNGANPTGVVSLQNQFGCDSMINVQINLASTVMDTFRRALCDDQDFIIGGETFNFGNPQGTVTIPSATGCDTIVDVLITPLTESTGTFDRELCEGSTQTFDVNGTPYGLANSSGIETFIGGSANGCDSIVTVSIGMLPRALGPEFLIELCENDNSTVEFNGTDYSLINNMGTETFVGANNCDSLVEVRVAALPISETMVVMDFCQDTILTIGNGTYGPSNLSGTEILTNEFGCDSIIEVELSFSIPSADFSNCPRPEGSDLTLANLAGMSLPAVISINGGAPITISSLPIDLGFFMEGNIDYEITGVNGCMLINSFTVTADPQAGVTILSSETSENTFELSFDSPIAFDQISWSPAGLVDCPDCEETSLTINSDQEVELTITTSEGCTYMDNLLLTATTTVVQDSTIRVYLPTALSLSNGAESTFFPQGATEFLVDELRVYDRWGNLVFFNQDFASNEPANGWNPEVDYRVEQGVYVYMLQYTDPMLGIVRETGDLTVIR